MKITLQELNNIGPMCVQSYGRWALGFDWRPVTIARLTLNVLILYVRHESKTPNCEVVSSIPEARRALIRFNMPPKKMEQFLGKVVDACPAES